MFVSLFVHREPQQIFMGVNTEYRANLVKARVNVPKICFTYTGSIYQYKLFLISEASKRSLEYHWSDNKFPTAIPY